ncbi:hypothetical protein QFZ79_000337 [Arthrobacter sp. V4I6]|uniref:hypothetical protein n=1 Tax=Arthrobacter sp. V4I6 TaxID=3042281 RepID=UPI002789A0C0|nr:hypothetical protein [Arthrobacter sp. V4I6]MDQ0852226.1 hypothetical protein [Arthrobacter sp. V4I6]
MLQVLEALVLGLRMHFAANRIAPIPSRAKRKKVTVRSGYPLLLFKDFTQKGIAEKSCRQ